MTSAVVTNHPLDEIDVNSVMIGINPTNPNNNYSLLLISNNSLFLLF